MIRRFLCWLGFHCYEFEDVRSAAFQAKLSGEWVGPPCFYCGKRMGRK